MKKFKDEDILRVIKEGHSSAPDISKNLGISESNAFYRLRKLKEKGLIDQSGKITTPPSPSDIISKAVNREDKKAEHIEDVISTEVNAEELVPKVDPDYILRNVDHISKAILEEDKDAVVLIGEAGTGKTELARQYSARNELPFLRVSCEDGLILKELLGRREIINGSTYYKTGILVELFKQPSVILIDEVNALPSSKAFFLHELLDNRRIFIKDAGGGRVVNLHEECKIILACNPSGARYSGTQKVNVALADRVQVLQVPNFDIETVAKAFDTGNIETTNCLKQFYQEASRVIKEQNLRLTFSLRAVKRIAKSIKRGAKTEDALACGFYNVALLTASSREKDSLKQLAKVCFGLKEIEGGDSE